VLSTGLGKTRLGVVAAGEQLRSKDISSCLVVVPTIPLIEQWKKEFKKWEYSIDGIDFLCIRSAYKLDKYYDLIIVDEIHMTLSTKYRDVFYKLKYNQIMGLTATKPHNIEYEKLLSIVCPIVYTKTIEDAKQANAISNFIVYNLECVMNRSEAARYRLFDGKLKRAQLELGIAKRDFISLRSTDIFTVAKEYASKKYVAPNEQILHKYAKQFWSAMTLRK